MKNLQLLPGVISIAFGLVFIPESWKSIIKATPKSYGQGYIPLFAAIGLTICGTVILVKSFQVKRVGRPLHIRWGKIIRGPVLSIISLIAYTILIIFFGFGLSTFLLMLSLLRILRVYSWPFAFIVAVVSAISFHYIFKTLLYLPLPNGILLSFISFP